MKKRAIWLILSCLMVLSLVLASCARTGVEEKEVAVKKEMVRDPANGEMVEKPRYGGMLNVSEPLFEYFDQYRWEQGSFRILSNSSERLLMGDWAAPRKECTLTQASGWTPPEYMKGQLLESWEFPDAQTVIMHLRKGVYWQNKPPVNGREFVADDLVWNYQRYMGSSFIDQSNLKLIESVEALDKYTVKLKLTTPQFFLNFMIMDNSMGSYQVAPESVGPSGEVEDWRKVIGTGPFMIKDYIAGSVVTFEKNPNYWDYDEKYPENRLPYVDGVRAFIIKDSATMLAALRSGKLDKVLEIEGPDAIHLQETNPELKSRGEQASSGFVLSYRNDVKPFTDVRVRQALSMSIDRMEIVDTFYGGWAYPYTGIGRPMHGPDIWVEYEDLPDTPMWTTLSCKEVLSYNPEKAKQLLAEAGYPNGFKTSIDFSPGKFPGVPEILQSYLADIGVDAKLIPHEMGVFNPWRKQKPSPVEQTSMHWISARTNPTDWLERTVDPTIGHDVGMVDDPVFREMIERMRPLSVQPERNKAIGELNLYVIENAFWLSTPISTEGTFWWPWLKGYLGESHLGAHNTGAANARVWIDQELKKEMGY
ncbi:ABC transporter substrate-binding protein [Chloroflexota bacterium]